MKIFKVTKQSFFYNENAEEIDGKYFNGIVYVPEGLIFYSEVDKCIDDLVSWCKLSREEPTDLWMSRKELYGISEFETITVVPKMDIL